MASKKKKIVAPKPVDEENAIYKCCTCGKEYKRQKGNFPMCQSPIYKGNHGHITTCRNCADELFGQYKELLGSEKEAMKRMCMKFDMYWNEEIFDMINTSSTNSSRVSSYISKANILKYQHKTYDDTIDEEREKLLSSSHSAVIDDGPEEPVVSQKVREFWGPGFSDRMLLELQGRYEYWLSKYPDGTILDAGGEALLRQICNCEIDLNRARAEGKSIDRLVTAFNNLLGSANLKPNQKTDGSGTYIPFGVEIEKYEYDDPIPEPDPEFEDVDGIRKNVVGWFLGHLCKMVGIKNSYVKEYEDLMKQYTIERPNFEEDESTSVRDDIFEDGDDGGDSGE